MKESCIFCRIAKGEIKAEKTGESRNFFAIKDIHPKVAGHTLVIPKEHYENLLEIPDNLGQELLAFTKQTAEKIMDENGADGFNVLMNNSEVSGQVVMHAHLHILPRKKGDGFRLVA